MNRRLSPKVYRIIDKHDKLLHWSVLALAVFGVVMQISASMDSTSVTTRQLIFTAVKQCAFFIVSYFGMVIMSNYFHFSTLRKNENRLFLILGLLVFLLLPLLFSPVGGSRAWIRFNLPGATVTIQPSEFAKIGMILLSAIYLEKDGKSDDFWVYFKIPFLCTGAFAIIIWFMQGDLGSAVMLVLISLVCMLVPSNKKFATGQILCFLAISGFLFMMVFFTTEKGISILEQLPFLKYQVVRFKAAYNPFTNRYGTGYYDLVNSLIAFNSGGIKGVGLGKSLRKYGYLSAADTDFILAVIVEELGIMGFVVVLVCYSLIIFVLLKEAIKTDQIRDKIILVGVAMYFLFHFIFNIGGVTCLIPLTGIPLLLVSSGGSSSLASMAAIGIAQSIIARGKK